MDDNRKHGALSIKTTGDKSEVTIEGTPVDAIFNWTALTNQICETYKIPAVFFAANLLPWLQEYRSKDLKESIAVNMKDIRRSQGGGGKP